MTTSVKSHQGITTRQLAKVAILSALAFVVMMIEFPLPIAPPFYKLDFSEVIVLMGGFALGPVYAVIIEALKILLNVLFTGTSTAFVGEFANFVMGFAFVFPAAMYYQYNKTKKGALLGMVFGTVILAVVSAFVNGFIMLPMYSALYHMPMETIVAMGSAIFPAVTNVFTFCLFCVVPFNIVKGVLVSLITYLAYKHVSPLLHS